MKKTCVPFLLIFVILNVLVGAVNADDWSRRFEFAGELEKLRLKKKAVSAYQIISKDIEKNDRTNSTALAKAAFGEGRCWETLKKYELALVAYMKVAYIHKSDFEPAAWYRIGYIFQTHMKKPMEAKTIYEKLQKDFPQDEHAGDALFNSAKLSEDEKLYGQAINLYEQMAGAYPKHVKADQALARVAHIELKRKKRATKAIEVYRRIDDNYPNSSIHALWRIGLIYEKELKDLDKAKSVYLELIDKYPRSKEVNKAKKRIGKIYKKQSAK